MNILEARLSIERNKNKILYYFIEWKVSLTFIKFKIATNRREEESEMRVDLT